MTIKITTFQSTYLRTLATGKRIVGSLTTEDALERSGFITKDKTGQPVLTQKGSAFVGREP